MQVVTMNTGKGVLVDKAIIIEVIHEERGPALRVVNASGETLTFIFASRFEEGKFHDLPTGADVKIGINLIEEKPEQPAILRNGLD